MRCTLPPPCRTPRIWGSARVAALVEIIARVAGTCVMLAGNLIARGAVVTVLVDVARLMLVDGCLGRAPS